MTFQWLWLRRFIRKRTHPVPLDKAIDWKERLSFIYMFICLNAFGIVVYSSYKGKKEMTDRSPGSENLPSSMVWANTLNTDGHVKVIRVSGLHKTGEYEFDKKKDVFLSGTEEQE